MSSAFKDLLAKKVDDVKRPEPVPPGSYIAVVRGHEFGVSSKKKTDQVEFDFVLSEALEDVDADLLELFGGEAKLVTKVMKNAFYITDAALFMLTDFLKDALEIESGGRNIDEVIPESTGCKVVINVTHSMANDGITAYANIDSFTSVTAYEAAKED